MYLIPFFKKRKNKEKIKEYKLNNIKRQRDLIPHDFKEL